jgi:hypothetical protein
MAPLARPFAASPWQRQRQRRPALDGIYTPDPRACVYRRRRHFRQWRSIDKRDNEYGGMEAMELVQYSTPCAPLAGHSAQGLQCCASRPIAPALPCRHSRSSRPWRSSQFCSACCWSRPPAYTATRGGMYAPGLSCPSYPIQYHLSSASNQVRGFQPGVCPGRGRGGDCVRHANSAGPRVCGMPPPLVSRVTPRDPILTRGLAWQVCRGQGDGGRGPRRCEPGM